MGTLTAASAEPLRVVVVGGGLISDTHARAIRAVAGARLSGFTGGVRSRRQAERFGVPQFADLAEAATRGAEAAVICTPSGTHATLGRMAAGLGLHVLVEKPIDLSLASARALVRECHDRGVVLSVVSQRRFDPGFRELSALVTDRRFGALTLGSAATKCWRDDAYYRAGRHGVDGAGGGGALINQGIHAVDLLCKLVGRASRVHALSRCVAHDIEVEDVALATVEFANGAVGTVEATTAFYSAISGPTVANTVDRLEIAGKTGAAILSAGQLTYRSLPTTDLPLTTASASTNALPLEPFRLQHADFVSAVRDGREPEVTGTDGLNALALVSAVYESARRGTPVPVSQERN